MYYHEAGKGSKQRSVDKEKFNEGWDRIFGKKDDKQTNSDCSCTTCKCDSDSEHNSSLEKGTNSSS